MAVGGYFALRPPYSVRRYQYGRQLLDRGNYSAAVDYLTDSIRADPDSGEALFARGQAFQRLGDFQMAYQDYDSANRLKSSPLLNACRGYCLSRLRFNQPALVVYNQALEAGHDRPALLHNNIGYIYLLLAKSDDAEKHLKRALQLDGNLQAAPYNMMGLLLRRTLRGQPDYNAAFFHAAKAIEIGPPTADLYFLAAAIYVRAAEQDPALIQPTIEYVRKAVQLGLDPERISRDSRYAFLQNVPAFQKAVRAPAAASNPPKAAHPLDPLGKTTSPPASSNGTNASNDAPAATGARQPQ